MMNLLETTWTHKLATILVGISAFLVIGQADGKRLETRGCTPVRFELSYDGTHINAFTALTATRNISCSTAQAMQRYSVTHELYRGFHWRGQHWAWTIYSRAHAHTATTMWTERHHQQVWSTTRFAVS
jgi:hypothetical protein